MIPTPSSAQKKEKLMGMISDDMKDAAMLQRHVLKIDIVEDQSMGLIDVHYHDKRDNELIKK